MPGIAAIRTVTGVEGYEVQYRAYDATNPNVEDWTDVGFYPASSPTIWVNDVRIGGAYYVRVRARGVNGLYSDWVVAGPHTVQGKNNPPAQPSAPALLAGYRSIYVSWTNPEDLDLAFVQVWASRSNTFGSATLVGRSLGGAFTHGNLPADGLPWYYWLVAVDTSENQAAAFSAGSATALTIADYEGIGDDGILSPSEKLIVVREYAALTAEEASLVSAAATAGVSSTAYQAAIDALTAYLGGLSPAWNDVSQNTPVTRTTWDANWNAVYTNKMALQSAIDAATTAGPPGLSNATVFIYRRSASLPTLPSATATYTFTTGALTGLNNSWSATVPAGSDPLYVSQATASSTGATDTIGAGEWSAPVIMVQDGSGGAPGTPAVSGYLTNESFNVPSYQNGVVASYSGATGQFKVFSGTTDVSASFSLSTQSNPQAITIGYASQTYTVSGGFDAGEEVATITIRATGSGAYAGVVIDKVFSLGKNYYGYEIVGSLPASNLFAGRMVYLTTDGKLYRYTGSAWTAAVPAADITGQLSAAQIASLAASQITGQLSAAQIASIAAAQVTGQLTAGQIASIAAGQVTGQIASSQLAVGVGANMLAGALPGANADNYVKLNWNPDGVTYTQNSFGGYAFHPWHGTGYPTPATWSLPDGSTFAVHQPNATAGGFGSTDFATVFPTDIGSSASTFWEVEPNKTYEFSAYLQTHRCRAALILAFYDASGTHVGETVSPWMAANQLATANVLSNYSRQVVRMTAPATAAKVVAAFRKEHTNSGSDSWLFAARPMLAQTVPLATEAVPWNLPSYGILNAQNIRSDTIETRHLKADSITTDKIAANAITAAEIAAGTITAGQIAAGTITSNEIAAGTIVAGDIAANTITASQIAAGTITSAQIAAGTIQASNIVANSITSNEIAANAITASELAANAITADKIDAGAVTAAKISVTDLSSINANIGTVTSGLLRNGGDTTRLDLNSGYLQFKDSTNMFVSGLPFGSSSQFLMWFGPQGTLGSATEANAKFYLKANGDAYFNGTLAANIVNTDQIVVDAVSERTNVNAGSSVTLNSTTPQTVLDMTLPTTLAGEPQTFTGFIDSNDTVFEGSNTTILIYVDVMYADGSNVITFITNKAISTFNDENNTGGWQAGFNFNYTPSSTYRRFRVRIRQNDSSASITTTSSFMQCEALKR